MGIGSLAPSQIEGHWPRLLRTCLRELDKVSRYYAELFVYNTEDERRCHLWDKDGSHLLKWPDNEAAYLISDEAIAAARAAGWRFRRSVPIGYLALPRRLADGDYRRETATLERRVEEFLSRERALLGHHRDERVDRVPRDIADARERGWETWGDHGLELEHLWLLGKPAALAFLESDRWDIELDQETGMYVAWPREDDGGQK